MGSGDSEVLREAGWPPLGGSQPLVVNKIGSCLHTQNLTHELLSGNGSCIKIPCEELVNVACVFEGLLCMRRFCTAVACTLANGSAGCCAGRTGSDRLSAVLGN